MRFPYMEGSEFVTRPPLCGASRTGCGSSRIVNLEMSVLALTDARKTSFRKQRRA